MVSLNLYTLLFEIITVLWQAFWGTMKAFGTAIWDNLPAILEIKKVMGYFTPTGMIALYLGVPMRRMRGNLPKTPTVQQI